MSHAAASAAPSPTADPALATLVDQARRYLKRWGLQDESTARAAAERLAAAVYDAEDVESVNGRPRLAAIVRRWVEAFARSANRNDEEWLWCLPTLLSQHPGGLLETPLPSGSGAGGTARVLPASEPRLMMQQSIVDSFEHVADVLHGEPESVPWPAARVVEPGS